MFAGVDIGGHANTWLALLEASNGALRLVEEPRAVAMHKIVNRCDNEAWLGIAIDAQLTASVEHGNGFRPADTELQSYLPAECRNWVASLNSLMGVPVRGRLLAEAVAPIVATILETHPRARLLLGLGTGDQDGIQNYKRRRNESKAVFLARGGEAMTKRLWNAWVDRFEIKATVPEVVSDGQLDALVCATVAALYV